MADEVLKRDQNRVTVLAGVTDDANLDIKMLRVDPITKRLLISGSVSVNGLIVGTSTITSGTDKGILYNNSGVLGEYTPSASLILSTDASKNVVGLSTVTYPSLTELSYVKGVTSAIQTQLNGKQASGSYEVTTNKATDFTTINNTLYPTVQAVNNAINTAVVGLLDYRGSYDASVNTFPATGGSGLAGAILKGDFWICSVSGTLGGTVVTPGDLIIALQDTPAQTASNWDLISNELGYTPENIANKVTSLSGASTDTQYPSAKLAYDQLALKAPLASPTFTGNLTTPTVKITGGTPGLGKVLTSDADGDATWETPSAGGSSLWTLMPGTPTRVGNTSFTVTGDVTSYVAKGMIIKWTESSAIKVGMVSIPSTYGAPNTTITIIGDTMASIDASSLKYCMLGVEVFSNKQFAVAGNIGATGTNVTNQIIAFEPMRIIGCDVGVGTAGTTNSTTFDINKNGTTIFTTKPTLATTVKSSPTPFTADSGSSMALGDYLSLDVDAIQTTNAIDGYLPIYWIPTRYLNLS